MTVTRPVSAGSYSAGVTIHTPPETADRHIAVLYLHGGGLLYDVGQDDGGIKFVERQAVKPYAVAVSHRLYLLVLAFCAMSRETVGETM